MSVLEYAEAKVLSNQAFVTHFWDPLCVRELALANHIYRNVLRSDPFNRAAATQLRVGVIMVEALGYDLSIWRKGEGGRGVNIVNRLKLAGNASGADEVILRGLRLDQVAGEAEIQRREDVAKPLLGHLLQLWIDRLIEARTGPLSKWRLDHFITQDSFSVVIEAVNSFLDKGFLSLPLLSQQAP